MNTIHQQNNSDRLLGVIRLPIQLPKTVGRGCSGSVCSLPIHPYTKQWVPSDFRIQASIISHSWLPSECNIRWHSLTSTHPRLMALRISLCLPVMEGMPESPAWFPSTKYIFSLCLSISTATPSNPSARRTSLFGSNG